jgi:TonB family protein
MRTQAMAFAAYPLLHEASARSNRALAAGLAVSLAVHVLAVASVRPVSATIAQPGPLRVLILHDREVREPRDAAQETTARTSTPAAQASPPRPRGAVPESQAFGLPIDRYYTSREVDSRAEPTNQPALVYPQEAYQARVRGKVALRVLINQHGGVDGVTVLEAEPRGVFEAAALEAVQALAFSPALLAGRPVKSQKTLEVVFDPYESIATH